MRSLRLPRFKRSSNIRPLRLTDRDRQILKHVYRHRFLRSDHIAALTTGSPQQVLRRLQRLYHHGYLERPRCQIDYFQSGSRRIAYSLGNKGAAWLKRELSLPYHRLDWPRKNRVRRLFLEHALLISDVMVSIEVVCHKRTDVRFLSTDELNLPSQSARKRQPFQWKVEIAKGRSCGVVPDRVFGLEYKGKQCWYFLEADRGTMPIIRSNLSQSCFYRKLLGYEATWRQGVHRTRFGWQRFRVLTVTTNSERIGGMIEACRHLKQGRGLFLFAEAKAIGKKPDILDLRWKTVHEGRSASLLD